MNLPTFQQSGRRDVKSKSFPPCLSKNSLKNEIRLSIDHVKLPYISPAHTNRRDPYYHCRYVRNSIKLIKTDSNLYKGKVKLHVRDAQDLLSPFRRDSKPSKPKSEVKVFESPNSKRDISQRSGVLSEAVTDVRTPSPQHSTGSLEEIWSKFESALDEQYQAIRKHKKCLKLFYKNKKSSME